MSFRLPSEGSVLKKDWTRRIGRVQRSHIDLRNAKLAKVYPAGRRCKHQDCQALLRRTNPGKECQQCQMKELRQQAIIRAAVQMSQEKELVS